MALYPGARLGPYEIVAPLGAGGTGEVYRARDARLGREVAIKLLASELLRDQEHARRFEQEARAVAALEHANVLAIHDIGNAPEGAYLVTELLDGMTLDELLQRGPISTHKAVRIIAAAARGLAAAHEKSLVHRDLKPSNIFLTRDGRVKLLDFGLARLTRADGHPAEETELTGPGHVQGTPNYMSPEQALGRPVDPRSDIFALGAILYELLSGRRAFSGSSAVEAMTAIVYEDPPGLDELTSRLPVALTDVLLHCLEKDPMARFQSAGDLAFHLESVLSTPLTPLERLDRPESRPPRSRTAWPWLVAVCVVAVSASVLFAAMQRNPPFQPPELHTLTYSGTDSNPSAAPDGQRIAFRSRRDGISRIWLKELAHGHETALTEGPDSAVRFSPDGTQILFVREEEGSKALYRVGAAGGDPRRLLADVYEADWSPDGRRIVFLRRVRGPEGPAALLGVTAADGFGEEKLIELPTPFYTFPRWSPDGRWIALGRGGAGIPGQVLVVSSDGTASRVIDTGTEGRVQGVAWAGDGSLSLPRRMRPRPGSVQHRVAYSAVVSMAVAEHSSASARWGLGWTSWETGPWSSAPNQRANSS
ncbi:MAG: protein kinase domain-containing protein [Thermoanaerobaculia bacterium]